MMFAETMHELKEREARFRVTSVKVNQNDYTMFMGSMIDEQARVVSSTTLATIKSKKELLPTTPSVGQVWHVKSDSYYKDHEANGYMYKLLTFENPKFAVCTLPENGEQFVRFIADNSEFKGIGIAKARALWDHFGPELYTILGRRDLDGRDRHDLSKIISDQSVNALYDGFKKYENLKYANRLSNLGIPASVQQSLFKYHGAQSVHEISQNPYKLLAFGMSFKAIDELRERKYKNKIPLDNEKRLSAALEEALRASLERGNTYATQNDLKPVLRRLVGQELISKAFQVGFERSQYIIHPDTGNYHQSATLIMEGAVAKRFKALASYGDIYDEQANKSFQQSVSELPYDLTDKQTQAVVNALAFKIACITGGAGTGKTTVLRTVLRAMHFSGYQIHAIALSGRAAMRMHESIGFLTSTIAAFLSKEEINDDGKHVVVIDEASMIDIATMYRIVTHIHPNVRLLFVGDPDQLPPISAGKVLDDIVKSGTIMNTMLDIVKRQEGSTGIPEYSAQVRDGIVPLELTTGHITFHETADIDVTQKCVDLYAESPSNSRIVGATYRSQVGGLDAMNSICQQLCNPDGEMLTIKHQGEMQFVRIRKGDQILFVKNNYEKGVRNGSLGTLTSVEHTDDCYGTVTLDTNEEIALDAELFDMIKLGYAISLHKAQGSQFPRIIIALTNSRIVDRSWLYTAITRAETEVHIVGQKKHFESVIKNESTASKRKSNLVALLSNQ